MLAALVLYLLVEVSLGFEVVGPTTGLEITNQYLAPDGFTRSFVFFNYFVPQIC